MRIGYKSGGVPLLRAKYRKHRHTESGQVKVRKMLVICLIFNCGYAARTGGPLGGFISPWNIS